MKTCNIRKMLDWGYKNLKSKDIDSPRVDARLILAYLMGTSPTGLYLEPEIHLDEKTVQKYKNLIEKRGRNYPVYYLLGKANFMGLEFKVTGDTLIPRPETEIMTENVIDYLKKHTEKNDRIPSVLDMGTGCGNIGITIANAVETQVTAVDIDKNALKVAKENACFHGVKDKITFLMSNLFENLDSSEKHKYDVIVSNPPYIKDREYVNISKEVKKEPRISLKGGKEGLDCIAKIIKAGPDYVKDNGQIFIEIGYSQKKEVESLLKVNPKIKEYSIIKDYNDIDRIVRAGVINE